MKNAIIFLNDDNCFAVALLEEEHLSHSGITEKNIGELVKVYTDKGYRVSLYRVGRPEYFAPTDKNFGF